MCLGSSIGANPGYWRCACIMLEGTVPAVGFWVREPTWSLRVSGQQYWCESCHHCSLLTCGGSRDASKAVNLTQGLLSLHSQPLPLPHRCPCQPESFSNAASTNPSPPMLPLPTPPTSPSLPVPTRVLCQCCLCQHH